MSKLKYFEGNLDGTRMGLVAATSKKEAARIAGTGLRDFNNYWSKTDGGSNVIKPNTLYTRKFDSRGGPWVEGKCK